MRILLRTLGHEIHAADGLFGPPRVAIGAAIGAVAGRTNDGTPLGPGGAMVSPTLHSLEMRQCSSRQRLFENPLSM